MPRHLSRSLCVMILFLLLSCLHEASAQKTFKPTCEWAAVPDDVSIPKGLEVRIDMQTGAKLARSICDSGQEHHESRVLAVASPPHSTPSSSIGHSSDPFAHLTLEEQGEMLAWAERHREMMEVVEDRLDVMQRLVSVLVHVNSSTNDMVEALEILEDMVHQVDTAVDLYNIGGFPVLVQLLSHPAAEVRLGAVWTLGTAAQNNNKTQYYMSEGAKVLPSVLALLSDPNDGVVRKAVYALGALVRGNAVLQQQFLSASGMVHLRSLLDSPYLTDGGARKVLGLLSDGLLDDGDHEAWVAGMRAGGLVDRALLLLTAREGLVQGPRCPMEGGGEPLGSGPDSVVDPVVEAGLNLAFLLRHSLSGSEVTSLLPILHVLGRPSAGLDGCASALLPEGSAALRLQAQELLATWHSHAR